jgi:hypothetical protein
MFRNASASEDGANLESALVFAVSFALACDPIIAPTTVANDASRNVLRVKTVPPSGTVITGEARATDLRDLVIAMLPFASCSGASPEIPSPRSEL